ncbi:hypothetical protein [Clostridium butyricum]
MNELMGIGKVFIQWGAMIIAFGLGTMAAGSVLILLGKIFCGKQIDQALGFIANYINENVR